MSMSLKSFLSAMVAGAINPLIVEALDPALALQVSPLSFRLANGGGRREGYPLATLDSIRDAYMADAATERLVHVATGRSAITTTPLLSIRIGRASKEEVREVEEAKEVKASPWLQVLDAVSVYVPVLEPCEASVVLMRIAQGTELACGHAALNFAHGFGSIFGHKAKVEINTTMFDDPSPARCLIGLSGNVNPFGPVFVEFHCGAILANDRDELIPAYGRWWARSASHGEPQTTGSGRIPFSRETGFRLELRNPFHARLT
jgi:hypothetical protein